MCFEDKAEKQCGRSVFGREDGVAPTQSSERESHPPATTVRRGCHVDSTRVSPAFLTGNRLFRLDHT